VEQSIEEKLERCLRRLRCVVVQDGEVEVMEVWIGEGCGSVQRAPARNQRIGLDFLF